MGHLEIAITVVIPFVVLFYLNSRIFCKVTTRTIRSHRSPLRQRRENSLGVTLIVIVLMFLTCHSLKFFLSFYRVYVTEKTLFCSNLGLIPFLPRWMHIVSCLSHLMLMMNSSCNFVVYCLVGSRFRQTFLNLLNNPFTKLKPTMEIKAKPSKSSQTSRGTDLTFLSWSPRIQIGRKLNNKG